MPILTPSPPPQQCMVRSFRSENDTPLAQGPTAMILQNHLEDVNRHWHERSTVFSGDLEFDLIDDSNSYMAPQFKVIGKRTVKYSKTLPLAPRQIDWDIDDFEDFE